MVNPMIVEGQTLGGAAQGIGTALLRGDAPYDDNGQPLAATLADYLLPGATDMPHIADPSHRDAVALHRIRHQGRRRRRRHRAAGGASSTRSTMRCDGLGVEITETPVTPHKLVLALAEAPARKGGPGA